MSIVPGRVQAWLLPIASDGPRAPTPEEIRQHGTEITHLTVLPSIEAMELPALDAIDTYQLGSWSKTLCLTTRWEAGDPQPMICARETGHVEAGDDRHLTYRVGRTAGQEPYSWREGE